MLLPRDDLELQLREFGVQDLAALLKRKTSQTDKLVKPSDLTEAPRRVPLDPDQCKKLCEKAGLQYRPGYENRVIERVTTTEAPDRYGDIVRAKGIDNANYRKNAVVLFSHDHGDFPVGKSIKEWMDNSIKGWRSWDLYLGDEVDTTGRSELTFRMVDSGAMPGGSIGFMPLEAKCDHTPDERSKLGLGRFGVEYIRCEKLEHSACSIPANPEALSNCLKSIEQKKLQAAFAQKDVDRMVAQKMLDEQLADVFASVLGVKRTIIQLPPVPIAPQEPATPPAPAEPVQLTAVPEVVPTVQNITVNVEISEAVKRELNEITQQVKTFTGILEKASQSFGEKSDQLMAATMRALSALEQRSRQSSLYDRRQVEEALKI